MSPTQTPLHDLAQQSRVYSPVLLDGFADPHAELLAMVWGPRFDREHAMALWADLAQRRSGVLEPQLLQALLAAADRFDRLTVAVQHRLRRLILRHRDISGAAM